MRYFWNFKTFIITLCFATVVALISMMPQKIERTIDKSQHHNTQIETFSAQKQSLGVESVKKENEVDGVYRTKYGKCYHREGCMYLKSEIYISIENAKNRGLRPCKICMPGE